jgi:hypothetical protein
MTLAAIVLLQIVDWALTLGHSVEELKGHLADYFGAIAGVRIPPRVGVVVFFRGLTVMLWLVGAIGIIGTYRSPNRCTVAMLGLLIGCRVADGLFSHVVLHVKGFRPNPGLKTTPLYFAEAVLLCAVFAPRLRQYPASAIVGFLIGSAMFYAILPLLRRYGPKLWPTQHAWQPGSPRPVS